MQLWTAQRGRDLHAALGLVPMSLSGGDGRSFQADAERPEATCLGAFAEVTFTEDGRPYSLTTAMHLSGP